MGLLAALRRKAHRNVGQVSLTSAAGWEPVRDYWRSIATAGERITTDARQLVGTYRSWIYACASKNAQAVAKVPLRLYAKKRRGQRMLVRWRPIPEERKAYIAKAAGDALDEETVEILEHPVLTLLKEANEREDGFAALELLVVFLELTGRGYWLLERGALGVPSAFYTLPAQYMREERDKRGRLTAYIMGLPPNEIRYKPEEIIAFRYPSPLSMFGAYSPAMAAWGAVQTQDAIEAWQGALFENSAMPPAVISPKENIPIAPEQWEEFQERWRQIYAGMRNQGKTALLNIPVEIVQAATSPKDLNFLAGREWTRREIANIFGVPQSKLDMDNANRASAEQGDYEYQNDTILPKLKRIEAVLNAKLLPHYKQQGLMLLFDDPVPRNREYMLRRAEIMSRTSGLFSKNELRIAFGADPMPEFEGVLHEASTGGVGGGFLAASPRHVKGVSQEPEFKTLRMALRAYFRKQRESVVAALRKNATRFEGKAIKAIVEINLAAWDDELAEISEPFIRKAIMRGGKRAAARLSERTGERIVFDPQQPAVVEFVRTNTFKFAHAVNAITESDLRRVLTEGLTSGATLENITDMVMERFAGYERWRARRVAATEISRSIMAGEVREYADSGVVEAIRWRTLPDACEFCQAIEERYGEDSPGIAPGGLFAKLGDSIEAVDPETGEAHTMDLKYSDTPHPPLHPNCKCYVEPVLAAEYRD